MLGPDRRAAGEVVSQAAGAGRCSLRAAADVGLEDLAGGGSEQVFAADVGQLRAGITTKSHDGLTPAEQLTRIADAVGVLARDQQKRWRELRQMLAEQGIVFIEGPEVTKKEKIWLEDHFLRQIFPLLTPLAIDPAHPFPFIPNLGFTIALHLARASDGKAMNALIRMPNKIDRFIRRTLEDAPPLTDEQTSRLGRLLTTDGGAR